LVFFDTAIRIGLDNLPFGIGMNEYPYYFRQYRDMFLASQLGISADVYSDSAHNIFLDMFVSGGPLLVVSYSAIFVLALWRFLISANRMSKAEKTIGVILVCFLFQALISPPQLSILLWGHICAAILARPLNDLTTKRENAKSSKSTRVKESGLNSAEKKRRILKSKSLSILLCLLMLFSSWAPLRSDFAFRESLYTQDLMVIQSAATGFPTNSARLRYAASVMCVNKSPSRAKELLLTAISQNPRDFENLRYLLRLDLDPRTRMEYSNYLHRLDPEPSQNSIENLKKIIPDCLET
jgi:hypothetical protein